MTAIPVIRTDVQFDPDPRRVIIRPFLPDDRILPDNALLQRILAMADSEVAATLAAVHARFEDRHLDLEAVLMSHFAFVSDEVSEMPEMSPARCALLGAYYTHEVSIETAALTNPSIVPAPDQSGLEPGALRFILSLRAIGEGHTSSIEFRCGVIDSSGAIRIEQPSVFAGTGSRNPPLIDKSRFMATLVEMDAFDEMVRRLISGLPDPFELHDLEAAIAAVDVGQAPRRLSDPSVRAMHLLATSNYETRFAPESKLSERVLFPWSPIESHGMEDARFVRFTADDGSVIYYATYTAYDGFRALPQLIETVDFMAFRIATLAGRFAQNKGAALFPRRIDGRYAALSRYDTESNYVMLSDSLWLWEEAEKIESPELPWELKRVGNSGSPLETEAGWLVITHGVGPLRTYSLGALLLDINDPCRVIGHLDEPLLVPTDDEREGYVPNVVYSCGSLIHGNDLVLPFGFSDVASRIAKVPLEALLTRLTE
ncbi:MAG TPA: glycoside hydrolase family 130 protein [Acidimicrobiia bacterium]|nr:glycoside hydrolase family 130 protein [Acidimicrobiia bacterium]